MTYNIWKYKKKEKICVFDIDDTLSHSTKFWIDFVNKKAGTNFKSLTQMKNNLSYNYYRNIKHEFRTSGIKVHIPVRKEAKKVLYELLKLEYTIIMMTARPFDIYKKLFKTTTEWLRRNELPYDGIIWGHNKHVKIMSEVENIQFIVEDHAYVANNCAKFGVRTYLMTNIYNKNAKLHKNVIRIKNLNEVLEHESKRHLS